VPNDIQKPGLSAHKIAIREGFDSVAPERDRWIRRNAYFYEDDHQYMRFLVPEGLKILDLGCGTGQLLAALKPSQGVGVDLSEKMVEVARRKYPELTFRAGDAEDADFIGTLGGPFDVIVLSDLVGFMEDCETTLANLHRLCTRDTRLVISYYSHLWGPFLRLAEAVGDKMPQSQVNWLSVNDIAGLLYLADFEVIKREWRQLVPKRLFGLGPLINRYIATLPVLRSACLRNYIVARPTGVWIEESLSTSVIIPCRNESGNIENAVRRMPRICDDLEIVFVEGHSTDQTYEECLRVKEAHGDLDIKVLRQDGVGKGDAVRLGFTKSRGDVLMILDADLTVPPESLPKFFDALVMGKGDFINGTRLVYPLESGAMRFLNFWANRAFAVIFSWLLNQRFTDTLCGTKVLTRKHYERISANRSYFGDFDPFGDFDLIFGAAKLNLKILEIPVRYAERRYGATQISRFTHGWLLARMVLYAYKKLKAL
jgi:SAM-dependent methyltransferase